MRYLATGSPKEESSGTSWAKTVEVATTSLLEALAANILGTLETNEMGFEIDELLNEGHCV
jgi:hypothetical protein